MTVVRSVIPLLLLLCLVVNIQQYRASRILHEQQEVVDNEELVKVEGVGDLNIQSLLRAPSPPSESSGCTNIPGGGGPSCPMSEMHFAGDAFGHPRAYPRSTISQFGVTADQKRQ
ncbi:uncharacterized protein LOC116207270 [Punica granatum]|uniref:Uncharacterized protein n=2 Tax=Punica granatum TaxID=22663 RepID=A0A218W6I3_PUNGR|nr:uncharacterized protein LOC116207270 [Punica granatum]OWM68143.1 hypothetical protein CDL15_Pgr016343 [Punica granatum]PKI67411.1 hypothetical protein CRG98_012196 [Punica granatum]